MKESPQIDLYIRNFKDPESLLGERLKSDSGTKISRKTSARNGAKRLKRSGSAIQKKN